MERIISGDERRNDSSDFGALALIVPGVLPSRNTDPGHFATALSRFTPESGPAADGRIYVFSVDGKATVVKAGGNKPVVLHRAEFGERIAGTPALVGNKLYLRTQTKLYAFGAR